MKLARLAIHQPIFISMVLAALTLSGILLYMRMGVDLYPDISNPIVSVSVQFPGASPEDVERLITKPLEETVTTVSGVDSISSSSREGSGSVTISFVVGHDIQQGAQEVRERLDTFKRRLPDGAEDPILMRFDPNTSPFLTAALQVPADMSPADRQTMINEIVVPRLERLTGVAAVNVGGLRTQEVGVDLNALKLKATGVTPAQVVAALQRENVFSPSGRIQGGTENVPVRTTAQLQNLDDIRKLVVVRQGTSATLLQDVADVSLRLKQQNSYTRINGQDTLVLSVQKQSGSNEVSTAHLVRDEIASLGRDYPQLTFSVVRDDSTFIEASDRDVTLALILGAIFAGAIVLLFFRNLRNTLITIAGLPIVVIGTFTVISLLGYTRNVITLMALSLSIGLLIDDAIVVRENIFRHMEEGASPKEAAEKATGEIAFAVLAMTLTLVAVFAPVAFTSGQVGMLLKEFGITVSVATLLSLFEAFTLAPLLTAYLARPMSRLSKKLAGWERFNPANQLAAVWPTVARGYGRILAWSLGHRWLIAGVAVASFALAFGLLRFLPTTFFPTTDPGTVSVGISLPPGSPLAQTDKIAKEVELVATGLPEVDKTYAQVGGGSQNSGSITVYLKDGFSSDAVLRKLRQSFTQYGNTLTFAVPRQFLGVGGGGGGTGVRSRPVLIALRGPIDIDALDAVANQMMTKMGTVPGIRDVIESLPSREPEVQIAVDRQRAALTGVSSTTVGQTIRTLISGTAATQVDWDQRLDVTVQLRPEDRTDATALMGLPIANAGGALVPLSSVATISRGTGPTVLDRQNRLRQIMVGANIDAGLSASSVIPSVQDALSSIQLPAGVTWAFSGDQSQTQSAFGDLIFALLLGLVFIYMVLASQFGSLIHPLTVMVALPLSAIGAVLALLAARAELSVVAVIGIILLMGLVTKNSILLVDFTIRYRREGKARNEAVLAAGPVRLRPILMTTLAVILGMVPTALGLGAAGGFRAPMAIAVIGGVVSSSLLSLVVVPVAYTLLDDAQAAITRRFHRRSP